MKIVIGLGNPGEKYKKTRHNVGFLVVDKIVQHPEVAPVGESIKFIQNHTFKSNIAITRIKGERIILVKPETFMNSSGEAVSKILQYYKARVEDLIVILDDVDLPLGQIRIRLEGSSAGHRGLQNIIDILGTDQFSRIRVGIAKELKNLLEIDQKDNPVDTKDYVLSTFERRELPELEKVIAESANQIVKYFGQKSAIKSTTIEIR